MENLTQDAVLFLSRGGGVLTGSLPVFRAGFLHLRNEDRRFWRFAAALQKGHQPDTGK